jgi:hypothetical protein
MVQVVTPNANYSVGQLPQMLIDLGLTQVARLVLT